MHKLAFDIDAFEKHMEACWRKARAEIPQDCGRPRVLAGWVTAATWNSRAAAWAFLVEHIQSTEGISRAAARAALALELGLSDRQLARQMQEMSYAAAEFRARLDDTVPGD